MILLSIIYMFCAKTKLLKNITVLLQI